MKQRISVADLEGYLDESLDGDEMARIESSLRADSALVSQMQTILSRRDAGVHTLGEIWRRHRLTCVSRELLGSHLLGILTDGESDNIRFHIETIGCRRCKANLDDLMRQQGEAKDSVEQRRRRYFQSSAGYLRQDR